MLDPHSTTCRFGELLAYFGESGSYCGQCDVCTRRNQPEDAARQLLEALRSAPDQRLQIAAAAQLLPLTRSDFLALLTQGCSFGWWNVDADGWMQL